jgi:tRNA-Thr(GGU) m(6)t(6)A37 methyltransferase TsaA
VNEDIQLRPIGIIVSSRSDPADTVGWGNVLTRIELVGALGAHSLEGLEGFSHVEIIFWFHRARRRDSYAEVSRPRGRDDMPLLGVFASRGPNRPNPLGTTACELVEVGTNWLTVRGLDAVDGSPVIDIKPVMKTFLPEGTVEPQWSSQLMADYYTG